MKSNICRYRPLYTSFIMLLFPELSSCCKEDEDNLPPEGMSRPGGVTANYHQPSLLASDINCIRGWWANSGKVEVHIKRHMQILHRGHGGKLPGCAHSRLWENHREKRWIKSGVAELQYFPIMSPVGQSVWKALGLGIHVGRFIMKAT